MPILHQQWRWPRKKKKTAKRIHVEDAGAADVRRVSRLNCLLFYDLIQFQSTAQNVNPP